MQLEQDHLFEALAIAMPKRGVARYFFGDNIEGYLEGHAYRYAAGDGYRLHGRSLFRDFLSWRGKFLNDKAKADRAFLYPYGIRHRHSVSWWDECMLLRRRHAVALRISSRKPESLALAPMLELDPDELVVQQREWGYLLYDRSKSFCIGVSSSQPFRHVETGEKDGFAAPRFRTARDESDFTLYLAFADHPRAAQRHAEQLREDDGVRRHKQGIQQILTRSYLWTSDTDYNRALMWAKLSSYFLVEDEFGKGIWAGLPWFKNNWGRDTFIALPGTLLVTGRFEDAKEVIRNFAHWQCMDKKSPDYGRVPNRVTGTRDADKIYNTADGTPWLIRELYEYLCYTGDTSFAEEMFPTVKTAIEGAIKHYVDDQGLMTHDDADTWMDARIRGEQPWSARGNRANDIQALWFTSLQIGARLAGMTGDTKSAKAWSALAGKVKTAFNRRFWDPAKGKMADRLRPDNTRDLKVRPNQLMTISVPMIDPLLTTERMEKVVRNAAGELLFPYGIASLSQKDPYFHPYHHHEDDAWYHFDAAYHNGTVWGWNAGFTVTALCRTGQTATAWALTRNLADQILNHGCRGGMSELLDAWPNAKGNITLSGTWTQAWSTSEFARNGYQDYGGFDPRLLENELRLKPSLPLDWDHASAGYPFGRDGTLHVAYGLEHGKHVYVIRMEGGPGELTVKMDLPAGGYRFALAPLMKPADTVTVVIDNDTAMVSINGTWADKPVKGTREPKNKPVAFAKPDTRRKPGVLKKQNMLEELILAGKYR